MQKNIKTYSISTIIAIAAIASVAFIVDDTSKVSEIETQKTILQEIRGALPNYTIEELASGTQYAIIGTVKQITPVIIETDRMQKTVFSDVVIEVQEDLNNNYGEKEITVRIQGGTTEELKTISHVSAGFVLGETALFFVPEKELESVWGDNYYVAGGILGKYSLNDGQATRDGINDSMSQVELVSKIQQSRG